VGPDLHGVCVLRKFHLPRKKGTFRLGRSSVRAFLVVFLESGSLLVIVLGAWPYEPLSKGDLPGVDVTGSPFMVAWL